MSKSGPEPVKAASEVHHAQTLMGRHTRALDGKKRLVIPSAWREALGPDMVYVLPDPATHQLRLIPKGMMDARLEEFRQAAFSDARINALLTTIGESSELLEFDSMGRIRICDRLLAFARISEFVLMRGSIRMVTLERSEGKDPDRPVDAQALSDAMAELNF